MKLVRGVFIFMFVAGTFILSAYAVMEFWNQSTPAFSSLGLLMAAAPLWVFVFVKGPQPQKPDAAQAFGISCVCGAGLAITMTSSWKYNDVAGIAHLWAGACLLGWVLYLKWYNAGQQAQQTGLTD